MKLNPEEVACYLQEHPQFFEEYADTLAEIYIPHPHGGRAIPISERQIVTLRDKNRILQDRLRELIRFGEENDAIGEKIHRLAVALLRLDRPDELLHSLESNLREDFSVPHMALRLWNLAGNAEAAAFTPVSADIHAIAESLQHPYCGPHVVDEISHWFGEDAPRLRTFAMVPLRAGQTIGLLALGSEDPQRFYPEMGTLYLQRLGDLAGAALARHGLRGEK